MAGRLRQICQGINVDAGEAENYRQHWFAEAGGPPPPAAARIAGVADCPYRGEPVKVDGENKKAACAPCGGKQRQVFACSHPALAPHETTLPGCASCEHRPREEGRPLVLKNNMSPGDVLVMSAAIHSLHKTHPGKFLTAVSTSADAIFEHNPDITDVATARRLGGEQIEVHYPAIHQSGERGIHFMQAYCEFLSDVLKVPVPLMTNRPHVHLSAQERSWMNQVEEVTGKRQRFWLVSAGRKSDYTTKFWSTENYQSVVNALRGKILFVQVGAAEHHHPPLRNVLNLVGKTDMRQLIRLAWHAEGILSGVTLLQHLAAALQKPSVVIMGGREPVTWNSYPKQHLLHTVGAFSCCRNSGCWKSRVTKLDDGDEKDNSLCENPVIGDEVIPKCMSAIKPSEVAEKILMNL